MERILLRIFLGLENTLVFKDGLHARNTPCTGSFMILLVGP